MERPPETAAATESAPGRREGAEGDLLLRHRQGDPGAFRELVERYRAPAYSYLIRCGVAEEDRDDLFQEIFLKVHRAARRYDPRRPLHPWIFTIIANTVRHHLRRRRVRQLVFASPGPAQDPADASPDGERTAAARQTAAWLEEEIRELPLAQREALILACVESLPLRQVAEVLGTPLNTVKTHLRRARLRLTRSLERRNAGLRREALS